MKLTGRALCGLLLSLLIFAAGSAHAELSASVDRDRVTMGDTLRLTITATGNELIGNLDLRPLLSDFEILQRSTSSSTSIINGKKTSSRTVNLDITPRRTGTLKIPALPAGDAKTNFLIVSVSPPASGVATDQTVSFEATVDQDTVYVQGQVLLTMRIMQSINLESRSVTELQLDNAFVKQLEQQSFQRTIDGRPWLVHEIRYAIFPEESGTLEIPSQTFSARESTGRRSMMGFSSGGRQLNRKTKTISLKVLPRPDSFPGTTWLPARKLEIQESWSTPPDQLHTGESVTRTIRIMGEGLQGAQLPPTLLPATEGLKYYPDQPVIGESESSTGLTGSRNDSAALIPTREGRWTIPEVRIPWWDTKAGKVRYAVLPEREVVVSAGTNIQLDSSPIAIVSPTDTTAPVVPTEAAPESMHWKIVAIVSGLGWLLTLIYLLFSRNTPRAPQEEKTENISEKKAFKQLLAACSVDNPVFARRGIIDWTGTLFPEHSVHSLEGAARVFRDDEFSASIVALNNQLFSGTPTTWDGKELGNIVQRLRRSQKDPTAAAANKLELYPKSFS
ncbi:MAG: protein BatD [Proteobacteria bacterium]|nr:protein BatD [Pseudomonadota bacterium]